MGRCPTRSLARTRSRPLKPSRPVSKKVWRAIRSGSASAEEMESGELPLERALELFERGMKLSDTCRKQLEEAETRVEMLMKRAGEVQPEPLRSNKA